MARTRVHQALKEAIEALEDDGPKAGEFVCVLRNSTACLSFAVQCQTTDSAKHLKALIEKLAEDEAFQLVGPDGQHH